MITRRTLLSGLGAAAAARVVGAAVPLIVAVGEPIGDSVTIGAFGITTLAEWNDFVRARRALFLQPGTNCVPGVETPDGPESNHKNGKSSGQ